MTNNKVLFLRMTIEEIWEHKPLIDNPYISARSKCLIQIYMKLCIN